jgi:hypothetical protein
VKSPEMARPSKEERNFFVKRNWRNRLREPKQLQPWTKK